MNISVVKTFTPKNAGTENSEILNIKTRINEVIKAGLIKGRIILKITLRKRVITKPLSSNCELIFDKALPIISIDNGVNIRVKISITPKFEDM